MTKVGRIQGVLTGRPVNDLQPADVDRFKHAVRDEVRQGRSRTDLAETVAHEAEVAYGEGNLQVVDAIIVSALQYGVTPHDLFVEIKKLGSTKVNSS